MRLMASAYAVAEKSGAIARRVMQSGDLGIVEKVGEHVQIRGVLILLFAY